MHLSRHTAKLGGLPGRVVPPANRHVTLRFLGEVDDEGAERVRATLAGADLGSAFEARLANLGAFPRAAKARVLWIGFTSGNEAFAELVRRVDIAAGTALGGAGDRDQGDANLGRRQGADMSAERAKPFSAHITLSRLRTAANLDRLLEAVPALDEPFPVTEVVLFRSVLGKGPPVYQRVATYALPKANV